MKSYSSISIDETEDTPEEFLACLMKYYSDKIFYYPQDTEESQKLIEAIDNFSDYKYIIS